MKRKLLIGLIAVAGIIALARPFLRAERYRERIHHALETGLRRRVEIAGKVTFGIWNGPGFSITDVVIHEDPAIGIEPFAYVAALDANVSLSAMLQGRFEVASVLLDEPRVNLVKQESGSWNVRPFLQQPATGLVQRFPEIKVRSGRINLKFGDTKSALYLTAADMDITAESDSSVKLRFSVEPARTDRLAQGFGTLEGFGRYKWHADKPSDLDLDIELNRSALSEIVTLMGGPGAGLRGFLASKAKVKGPVTDLKIEGSLRLEELQRGGLLRSGGNWPIQYKGGFRLPGGELDVVTLSDQAADPRLRVRGHSLLEQPAWGAIAQFQDYPVAAIRDLFQSLSLPAPSQVQLDGKMSGVLGYSRNHGLQGMLFTPETKVKNADQTFRLEDAMLILDAGVFRLAPAKLDLGEGRTAELEGSYAPGQMSFAWRTGNQMLPVREFLSSQKQLLGVTDTPLLEQVGGGSWQGMLSYRKAADSEAEWDGAFTLRKAVLTMEGLAAPVEIESARGSLQANQLTLDALRGTCGGVEFQASYRERAAAARPHSLKLMMEEADIGALEKLMLPTLKRGGGILGRLALRNTPVPDWLKARHVDATVQIGELYSGETWLGSLAGRLAWDGAQMEMSDVKWQWEEASGAGKIGLNLLQPEPVYKISGEFHDVPWKSGTVDGEASVQTSGTGLLLVRNAKSTGSFQAKSLAFAADSDVETASGTYELTVAKGTPQLKLQAIEATINGEAYSGAGLTETDGRITVDLTSGKKKSRMAGQLWPFQLELAR